MIRDYELMYIVRPELDEDAVNLAVASVKTLIEANGGEVLKSTMWGKRRLAYEVKHLRDGFYVIDDLRLDGTMIGEVESALRIHDQVFRHMLVVHEGPEAIPDPPEPLRPPGESDEPVSTILDEVELDAVPAAADVEDA